MIYNLWYNCLKLQHFQLFEFEQINSNNLYWILLIYKENFEYIGWFVNLHSDMYVQCNEFYRDSNFFSAVTPFHQYQTRICLCIQMWTLHISRMWFLIKVMTKLSVESTNFAFDQWVHRSLKIRVVFWRSFYK